MNTAKQWSVSTASTASDPLQMSCAGKPLMQSELGTLDDVSPVEHLLLSIATCFALSCRAAFAMKKMPPVDFAVDVTGVKAIGLPSRLASIHLVIVFAEELSAVAAAGIAADAKKLCTVTNTLQAAPLSIDVEVRERA